MDEQAIFVGALERDDPDERSAFIAAACSGNEGLRERIARLLDIYGRVGSFLEVPAAPAIDRTDQHASVLGEYRILREIGRGGMGVVYEAEQTSLHRRVALKILPFATVLDPKRLQRFKNEAVAAASLKHSNIVQVYSVGCERGVHYYAMEYVEGKTLADVIAELRRGSDPASATTWGPPSQEAAELQQSLEAAGSRTPQKPSPDDPMETDFVGQAFQPEVGQKQATGKTSPVGDTDAQSRAQVSTHKPAGTKEFFSQAATWGIQAAEALEHAHQMGIVHRDVKPSNLLLDNRGHLSITDFGLAQIEAYSPIPGEGAPLTMTGDLLGTLRYMSPEQASGRSGVTDHHTDIYSLGVTLFELLALRPPFQNADRHALIHEIIDGNPRSPRQFNRAIPRDLETIVLKAMASEPQARYATAQQMADDLKRFLADEHIQARRPSLLERTAKWARRHQTAIWSAMATLLVAVAGLGVSTVLTIKAYRAEKEQHKLADQQRTRAELREGELRHYAYVADVTLAREAWKNADLPRARNFLSRHLPQSGKTNLRGFEWYYLWAICQQSQTALLGHTGDVYCLAFSPDGKTLASASQDGTVKLWGAAAKELLRTLRVHAAEVCHVVFSPDGSTLAATGDDGMVKLWEASTGREKAVLEGVSDDVFGVAFSPDGHVLATCGCDDTVRLWNAETLREEAVLRGHTGDVQALAFSPDGKTLASVSSDETLKLWDVASRRERATAGGHGKLCFVAYSNDGNTIATSGHDRTVRLWRSSDLSELHCFQGHGNLVHGAAFSPDGHRLASAGRDGTVRVWDPGTGELLNVLRGHVGCVWCVAYSPDGRTLVTAGADRTIKLWDPAARQGCDSGPKFPTGIACVAVAPDGTLLVCTDNRLVVWDPTKNPNASLNKVLGVAACEAAFSPDGRTLAVGTHRGEVQLWNVSDVSLAAHLGRHEDAFPVSYVAFSPDGRTLASQCDHEFKVWDVRAGCERFGVHLDNTIHSLAFSFDGQMLAAGLKKGLVRLWDAASGKEQGTLRGGEDESVLCLAFSPDGATLAAAGDDRVIRLWDLATASERRTLVGHSDWVEALAFTPDGKTLTSSSRDGTLRFWSPVSGYEFLSVETPIAIHHLAFSRDGRQLAGGGTLTGRGGEVYLWSAPAGSD